MCRFLESPLSQWGIEVYYSAAWIDDPFRTREQRKVPVLIRIPTNRNIPRRYFQAANDD